MSHYDTLGISPNATQEEIVRAYRSLAIRHHPDAGGNGDSQRFKQIATAYEVLRDSSRRRRYDETGDDTLPKDEAYQIVVATLYEVVTDAAGNQFNLEEIDLIFRVRKQISSMRKKFEQTAEKAHREAEKFRRIAERMESDGGENKLRAALLEPAKKMEQESAEAKRRIGVLDECEEILQHYKYRFDPPKESTWPNKFGTENNWMKFTFHNGSA